MAEPTIVPRSSHAISRRDIDPGALKVLYRLHEHHYIAYLVGGSVRDLLLNRHPKDFDIGTSAHPHQVKKLFRNCWIIGRRFRLAHVKFGTQTIEVATFRRQVDSTGVTAEAEIAEALEAEAEEPVMDPSTVVEALDPEHERTYAEEATPEHRRQPRANDRLIHRDNTYGTPEEDAFRRDFTVNALFYDIGTFSIIDYVGGLADLEARLIRCIGDPEVRFLEDPVRMLRAVVLSARLEFTIDQPILDAIAVHRHEIARSAPARLLEEYCKILRSGHAEEAMRQLRATKLMKEITPELGVSARRAVALDRGAGSVSRAIQVFARLTDERHPGGHAASSTGACRSSAAFLGRCARAPHRDRDAADRAARRRAPAAHHVDAVTADRARGAGARATKHAAQGHAGRGDHVDGDPRRPARRRGSLAYASGARRSNTGARSGGGEDAIPRSPASKGPEALAIRGAAGVDRS